MNSYQIILKQSSKYQAVIYSVSYNNPIQDIREISEYIRKQTNIVGMFCLIYFCQMEKILTDLLKAILTDMK